MAKYDEENLVICESAKKRFNAKKTVAVISDPKKTEFFYKMGVDRVVCQITAISSTIEQMAVMDEMETLISVGGGVIKITQVNVADNAPSVGKKLWEIDLPSDVIVGCVLRGEEAKVPRGEFEILAGDILVLLSTNAQEKHAIKALTGR
jgi:trk system potassium uptake protein TrkA